MSQGNVIKNICFEALDGDCARLMIKLRHEEITKKEFFTAILSAYLNDDPAFMEFIKKYKQSKGYPKWKQEILDREIEEGKELENTFALNKDEVDDIYDILEEEMGL